MISDQTTFFLAFLAIFVAMGFYLWLIEGRTRVLEDRLASLEAEKASAKDKSNPVEHESDATP